MTPSSCWASLPEGAAPQRPRVHVPLSADTSQQAPLTAPQQYAPGCDLRRNESAR